MAMRPGAARATTLSGAATLDDHDEDNRSDARRHLIIGAGPVGLACAIEAKREGLDACVIEKGALVNSLVGYPSNMEFFSTPELIEIGGYPFPVQGYKPTREEAIEYTAASPSARRSTSGCTSGCSRCGAVAGISRW